MHFTWVTGYSGMNTIGPGPYNHCGGPKEGLYPNSLVRTENPWVTG